MTPAAAATPRANGLSNVAVSGGNGKNLDGWVPKIAGHPLGENYLDTFRVENGVLKVSYDKYDAFDNKFGHLFYRDKFSHYIIAAEYRFVGDQAKGAPSWALRNNGLMLHSSFAQSAGFAATWTYAGTAAKER
jgi:hypothetical protein